MDNRGKLGHLVVVGTDAGLLAHLRTRLAASKQRREIDAIIARYHHHDEQHDAAFTANRQPETTAPQTG